MRIFWVLLSERSLALSVVAEVRALYADTTTQYAGGSLTELSHSLQAARAAEREGKPDAVVVAALLHDVGWKLARRRAAYGGAEPIDVTVARPPSLDCIAADLGIRRAIRARDGERPAHEDMGAAWLRLRGFNETTARLVEGHVLAKRYLVGRDPAYVDGLSAASRVTLAYQGGPMGADEARLFESDPLFDDTLALRHWDEAAKEVVVDGSDLDHFLPAVARCVVRAPILPGDQRKHFILNNRRVLCALSSS